MTMGKDCYMKYIVLDLEWNQSNTGLEEEAETLPFEVIEIGAVQLTDNSVTGESFPITDRFSELIKPAVYREMNQMTGKLIHIQMQQLRKGRPFPEVYEDFFRWCGEEPYLFCTWGAADLTELQRNIKFYHITPLSDRPIPFLDVQKLFSLAYEDGKSRRALEYAVDLLELTKKQPFHRAFCDAFYTAEVLRRILAEKSEVLKNVSYDVFHPPTDRDSEVKVQFDTYTKYISREFDSRQKAFEDREIVSSKCYLCHRNLRKKLKWFTANGRHYYCLAYCEVHGYLKGKIRVRKTETGKIYIVKTTKLISPEEAEVVRGRRVHAEELRRRRGMKKGL